MREIINIITLDLEEKCLTELCVEAIYYKCKIIEAKTEEELYSLIECFQNRSIVVMNIEKNPSIKINLTSKIKYNFNAKVIFIADKLDPETRVRLLSSGAEGYILAPFYGEELFKRAITLINAPVVSQLMDNNFKVDLFSNIVSYRNEAISVTPHLFRLIVFFVRKPNIVLSKSEITKAVHHKYSEQNEKNVERLIWQLRNMTEHNIITTIRMEGYVYNTK